MSRLTRWRSTAPVPAALLPRRTPLLLWSCLCATSAFSAPVYQPAGSNLTYGDVAITQRLASASSNPAAPASNLAKADTRFGVEASAVVGIEYGNIDHLYRKINELSEVIKPSDPDDGDSGGGDPGDQPPGGGINIGDIIDICCPDLADLIDRAEREIKARVALIGLIAVEGYAKDFYSVNLPFVKGSKLGAGAWSTGINWSRAAKAYGIQDPTLEFNRLAALEDAENQYNLMPGDPITSFDLAGDIDLIVDPSTGHAFAVLDSDATMVTKAAKTTDLWFGYSRELGEFSRGQLYGGVQMHYFALQLSRLSVRFGDITDAEAVFESIRDADYSRADSIGFDIGALWVASRYQLGATMINVNQPGFDYPGADYSYYREEEVIQRLIKDQRYVMERQVKLEASIFDPARRKMLNVAIDANDTIDPMGDKIQWATVSGGFNFQNPWLRSVRAGYRRNLVGSELSYISAGVSVFKWFDIDMALDLDRVEIKNDNYPRGFLFSFGAQVDF